MHAAQKYQDHELPVIVLGDGTAAVFLIGQLLKKEPACSIFWAKGSSTRFDPIMPFVKSEAALGTLLETGILLSGSRAEAHAGARAGDQEPPALITPEKGTFHRVFRNKAFKFPIWKKRAADFDAQQATFKETVWAPEQAYLGVNEFRANHNGVHQLEESLRQWIETHPQVKKILNTPIIELEIFEKGGKVQFANGLISEFSQFFYCDHLAELKTVPKLATVLKHQLGTVKPGHQMGILQVVFHHSVPLNQQIDSGLAIPMNRESGESFDRDVLGYFLDSQRSVWTVFLNEHEGEENHEIMKKLRKLKYALNKAFESPEFLPEGKKDFMATVDQEQVRYEANCLVTHGHFKESKSNSDFVLLNDAFGLSAGLEKIAHHFQIPPAELLLAEAEPEVGPEARDGMQSADSHDS